MEAIQIDTAQHVAIRTEIAGLGDRVLASLIDYCILAAYGLIAVVVFSGSSTAVLILLSLPPVFYFLLCEIFLNGQSIGKRARQIQVVRLDGTPPRLADYLLRWLLRPIDIWLMSGVVAVLAVLISSKGQRLGDMVAGTTVVKTRPRSTLDETAYRYLDGGYTPTFSQAERLSPADADLIREVLQVLNGGENTGVAALLSQRTKRALERKLHLASDMPPGQFLETLLRDYNFYKGHVQL